MADVLAELALYAAAIAACYAVSYQAAKRLFPRAVDNGIAGDSTFGLIYYPLLVALAADSCWHLYGDEASRWRGRTPSSMLLGRLLVSRMAVHMPYLWLKRTPAEKAMRNFYLFHHVLVIVNYGAGIVLGTSHFWGAGAALCESTNIFLGYDELLDAHGGEWPRARKCVSLGLNFTYAVFRLILFPALLVWLARDVRDMSSETWDQLGACELYLFPASIFFVLALSVKWAYDVLTAPAPAPKVVRRSARLAKKKE